MTARPWPDLSSNRRPLSPRPERLGWLTPVPEEERRGETALHARLNRDGSLYLRGLIAPETVLDFRRSFLKTLAPSGLTRPPGGPRWAPPGCGRGARDAVLFGEIVPGE